MRHDLQAHQHLRSRGWWQWKKTRGLSAVQAMRFANYVYNQRTPGATPGTAAWINLYRDAEIPPPQELWPVLDAWWPEFEKAELMRALKEGGQR